jgi:O-methyltransferase
MKKIKSLVWKISWFIKNYRELSAHKLLIPNNFLGPVHHIADSLATSNNIDFKKDLKFSKAYKLAEATAPQIKINMEWRTYIVCSLAEIVKKLEGDFVECGVSTGIYSRAVIDYVDFDNLDKTFYLMDTFNGPKKEQITENEESLGINNYIDIYKNDVYEQVCETFKSFKVRIIRGMIPETLKECKAEKICYLSIDMNVVAPEIAAANFFWDKLVSGGVMILDDYGFPAHFEQKIAFDKFAAEKGVQILYLPTAQGIIFKP